MGACALSRHFGTIDEISAEIEAKPLGVGGKAGIKFKKTLETISSEAKKWAEEHQSTPLATDRTRSLLCEAIERLLGNEKKKDYRLDLIGRRQRSSFLR